METSLLTSQRKKLVMIGLFLIGVVAAVGREEDPGMLQQIAVEANSTAAASDIPTNTAAAAQPVPRPRQQAEQTPDLDSWYSEAGRHDAPVEPLPEDKGWLINDAEPLVSTEPIR